MSDTNDLINDNKNHDENDIHQQRGVNMAHNVIDCLVDTIS
jgi:hypothetical protein